MNERGEHLQPVAFVRSGARERPVAEVITRSMRVAAGLSRMGLKPGDRYAIVMRNEIAYFEANFGAGSAGLSPVPVNWHWTGEDLRHLLHDSDAKVAIVHTDLLPAVEMHRPAQMQIIEAEVPDEIIAPYGLGPVPLTGRYRTLDQLIEDNEPLTDETPAPPLGVIYTSGTTGTPKGIQRAPMTEEQLANTRARQQSLYKFAPGASTICPAPLYHTAPNVFAMFALGMGLDITVMPRFDPEDFLRIVQDHQVLTVQMVPTMFQRLLKLPAPVRASYDVSSLEVVVHSAAPCPIHVKEAMIEWFGPIIAEYYGGSEGGSWTFVTSEESLAKPGTVGRAKPPATVKILAGDGRWTGPGEVGVIYGLNPEVMPDFTYIGDVAKRRSIEVDGLITVGDMGYLDEDGYLFLSDRANDMVISGGVNIYPAEIESVLHEMPQIEDAAVFGIPDEEYGERLAAHIQPVAGSHVNENEVRSYLMERLAKYKVPRVIVFEEQLPREDSGKLFKRRIREKYMNHERSAS